MNKPKFFKFCFPSGDPTGIARCAYDKVAIVAYRIPRGRIKDVKALEGSAHDDLQNPGIYMLIGKPVNNRIPFYVGQAAPRKCGDPIYNRLSEHDKTEKRTRDWWTTAFVFIDATNSRRVDETGLKYLENAIYVSMSAQRTMLHLMCEMAMSRQGALLTKAHYQSLMTSTRASTCVRKSLASAVRWTLVRIRPSLVCPSMGARNRARPI